MKLNLLTNFYKYQTFINIKGYRERYVQNGYWTESSALPALFGTVDSNFLKWN